MSKTIIKKKSKQKEVDPKFGVSEWDPAELDVRHTRHGTYESRPPPRGGTWRDRIKKEAYKLRQRQREEESPEFISPHSTTDTMDTDEAQEINKQITEKIEKEPEGAEYLNVIGEECCIFGLIRYTSKYDTHLTYFVSSFKRRQIPVF